MTKSDTEKGGKMEKAKFNLTDLLNSRSKEIEEAAGHKECPKEQKDNESEIIQVDVYDLIPSQDNFYHVDDDLKQSIELMGILQPLLVNRPQNGKYKLIAGHRRRLAVLSLLKEGKEEMRYVPCVYKKEDTLDQLALIMANRFRDKTDWEKMMEAIQTEELAKELKKEYEIRGRTREILTEITGVKESQLGRYKAIYNNLSPRLMEKFKECIINFSVAVELCGMSKERQEEAADRVEEEGTLSLQEARAMKYQEAEKSIPEKTAESILTDVTDAGEECKGKGKTPTEGTGEATEWQQEPSISQIEEYEDPQTENITSLCYSCKNYETCHEKKSTVTSCNAYVNREEANKTEEQRYNEQQAEIDRETERKLKEQKQEEKMQQLPSETEKKVHEITLTASKYEEIASETLTFYLLKNDGYRVGHTAIMQEYTAGRKTGREVVAEITYVWVDWTGLEDDYCIIGFTVRELRRRSEV